jgi:hypothetical protein
MQETGLTPLSLAALDKKIGPLRETIIKILLQYGATRKFHLNGRAFYLSTAVLGEKSIPRGLKVQAHNCSLLELYGAIWSYMELYGAVNFSTATWCASIAESTINWPFLLMQEIQPGVTEEQKLEASVTEEKVVAEQHPQGTQLDEQIKVPELPSSATDATGKLHKRNLSKRTLRGGDNLSKRTLREGDNLSKKTLGEGDNLSERDNQQTTD